MQSENQTLPRGNPEDWSMSQLEDFGRIRLSRHFFMRDMLYSEVASIHGLRNVPDDPALSVEVGAKLCTNLLEPLHAVFGHVSIRSAFRSARVNSCGKKYGNVARTKRNHARHVWTCPNDVVLHSSFDPAHMLHRRRQAARRRVRIRLTAPPCRHS